jgi:iron complex transport system permease protein
MIKRIQKRWVFFLLIPLAMFLVSFAIGKYPISIPELLQTLFYHLADPSAISDPKMETVLFNIRLPRVCVALLVGGGLSMAGASYQGMFKNPLVSPDILGASAGAGFAAALALYFSLSMVAVQAFAFVGGLVAVFLATSINRKMNYDQLLGLILGGILVSSLFSAGTSAIKFWADADDKLPAITFWLMGGLHSITKRELLYILPPMLVSFGILFSVRWKLNVLSFGEEEAKSLGIKTRQVRYLVIIAATLITAASVAACGMIGWVGLVIPHLCRALVGPNYRVLLPMSMILGASYLLLVDNIARCVGVVETPIGILTALIGVPFFVVIFKYNVRR